MKKVGVLFVLVCVLSGCSGESEEIERGLALRSKLLKVASCSFETEVTADYGEKMYTFSMRCQSDDKGDISFTVTAPETISGITGTVSGDGGRLTFDDVALYFERMADDQVTPVSAPWLLMKTLRSGCLTSVGMEEGGLRLSIDDSYEDDALHLDIWLDDKDLPRRAEILYDGRRILSLDVKNVDIV